MLLPDVPLTNRRPRPLSAEASAALLQQSCDEDRTDPFVLDPDPAIHEQGRLALRSVEQRVDYYFYLGDLCAQLICDENAQLNILYVVKAFQAFHRAHE